MRPFIISFLAALIGQLLVDGPATAAPAQFENLDRLDGLVATTVGANVGEQGGAMAPIDRRLRLAACPTIPSIDGPVFGAAIVRCDAIGWRIRVPLIGAAKGVGVVARPQKTVLVRKGDPVQLVAGNASFSVSRVMIADEDGAAGDMIRVREDRKSAPIAGLVQENGVVRVPGI